MINNECWISTVGLYSQFYLHAMIICVFAFFHREIVRKKAVLCLYIFDKKAPHLLEQCHQHFRVALCDRDPGVMWASLHFYQHHIQVTSLCLWPLTFFFLHFPPLKRKQKIKLERNTSRYFLSHSIIHWAAVETLYLEVSLHVFILITYGARIALPSFAHWSTNPF